MAISASAARADLFQLIQRVNDDQDAVEITTRRGSAFLVPEATYRSMLETLHVMRTRANTQHLLDSLASADRGELVEHDLDLGEDEADETPRDQSTDLQPVGLDAIRAWARENGHTVSERGRIANSVVEAYHAEHEGTYLLRESTRS